MFRLCLLLSLALYAHAQLTYEELAQFDGVTIVTSSAHWNFQSDGLTETADTSLFPGNRNPNSISEQDHDFKIPRNPTFVTDELCLPGGPIAIGLDGIPIFNPYTAERTDAVENEAFDSCQGHPDMRGIYHYHQNSQCVHDTSVCVPNQLIGVALDGVPIYGMYDESCNLLTSADLDECHGGVLSATDTRYVYRATQDFPYIMGCFVASVPDRSLVEGDRCVFAVSSVANTGNTDISTDTDSDGTDTSSDSDSTDTGSDSDSTGQNPMFPNGNLLPNGGNQQSGGSNQGPSSGNQGPIGGNQAPVGGNPGPVGGNQGPVGGNQGPVGGNQPPRGGNQPPRGGNQPPRGGNQPPRGGNQPPRGGNIPSGGNVPTGGRRFSGGNRPINKSFFNDKKVSLLKELLQRFQDNQP